MQQSPLEAHGNLVGQEIPPFVEHYTTFTKAYHCTISLASFIHITVLTPFLYDQFLYSKTCLKRNLKGPEYFSAEARFPFNQGIQ
jgi:hypothetical protein